MTEYRFFPRTYYVVVDVDTYPPRYVASITASLAAAKATRTKYLRRAKGTLDPELVFIQEMELVDTRSIPPGKSSPNETHEDQDK